MSKTSSPFADRTMKRLGVLCAHRELEIPLKLVISNIKFVGILAINKFKDSVDVRFRSDPIKNVGITSTFDSLSSARNVVRRMVEGQIREFVMVKLPIMASKLNTLLSNAPQPPSALQDNKQREVDTCKKLDTEVCGPTNGKLLHQCA